MEDAKNSKYIGHVFGSDDKYEVVGQYVREGKTILSVKCHECAKDPELFGDAVFTVSQSNFSKRGTVGCGCCKAPRWTESQQVVRILRRCNELSYSFNGFVDKYNGTTTKLQLTCLKDGNIWDSTIISHFLSGSGGCRTCHKETLCSLEGCLTKIR